MQNWKQVSHDAKDLLTVCLAKAIDQALTAQLGQTWFAEFAEADARAKVSSRITKANQRSVQDMDLQALLKFLRFRNQMTELVLIHFGFFEGQDSFGAENQRRQLEGLLERLMNDFRNRIEAHSRAVDIEAELTGQNVARIYGYEEAYQDMLKLCKIFASVRDGKGKSYYGRMVALTEKENKWAIPVVIAAIVLAVAALVVVLLIAGKENVYQNNAAPVVHKEQVSIQMTRAEYADRELVVQCYLTNGTEHAVSGIDVYSMVLTVDGATVASADFGPIEGLTLEPGESVKWQFRFPEDTVRVADAKLEDAEIVAFFNYR